jgi:hypothetical protein
MSQVLKMAHARPLLWQVVECQPVDIFVPHSLHSQTQASRNNMVCKRARITNVADLQAIAKLQDTAFSPPSRANIKANLIPSAFTSYCASVKQWTEYDLTTLRYTSKAD